MSKTKINLYQDFSHQLMRTKFMGDITLDESDRVVLSTDNSIYQIIPEGIIYPSSTHDICILMELLALPKFREVILSPRGGGTGTNGQSLTAGFIVDNSRYMNHILEINIKERWARVETGVIRDHLNAQIKSQGLFFAPELSTGNRATIGGMISTDASGHGSVIYGKTHDHVLELTSVLIDGSLLVSKALSIEKTTQFSTIYDNHKINNIYKKLIALYKTHEKTIATSFPDLTRSITGYDLLNFYVNNQVNINALLCGSEGTLAFISEAKINLLPLPSCSHLIIILYADFYDSLLDAQTLTSCNPTAIETIDHTVFALAKKNPTVWHDVHAIFPKNTEIAQGINFVEFQDYDLATLKEKTNKLLSTLTTAKQKRYINYLVIKNQNDIQAIWNMRKKAVGLLGNMSGNARPIPFVEDVAVPPQHLAIFIKQFRQILDHYDLKYGMFGHVDAGVLHVRPALDMKKVEHEKLIRLISDQVEKLARSYNGILWGEHGKGIRSEYAPAFFGELYPAMQNIKFLFDPYNQLNPGKIATPSNNLPLLKIDQVSTRGQFDRTIEKTTFYYFTQGLYCNGNGACFNYQPSNVMCPTWKATKNRMHSPKGRASLIRHWLHHGRIAGTTIAATLANSKKPKTYIRSFIQFMVQLKNNLIPPNKKTRFTFHVYNALDGCMACKACAGSCPVQVNIPAIRSRFFYLYHQHYLRPLKHYIAYFLEQTLPALTQLKSMYNFCVQSKWTQPIINNFTGLMDLPVIMASPEPTVCQAGAQIATTDYLASLSLESRKKTVIFVQDAFTSFFETPLLYQLSKLLIQLGYIPLFAPFLPSGKILEIYGFRRKFEKIATINTLALQQLAQYDIPLVGIDTATTLIYHDEYKELNISVPPVQFLVQWLYSIIQIETDLPKHKGTFTLLSHCTEIIHRPNSVKQWQHIFKAFGLTLHHKATGCCGMSGIYGHEKKNQHVSQTLYKNSWKPVTENILYQNKLVATGYSCRSQVKRLSNTDIPHPITLLYQIFVK